jgi:hypothetical protein
MTLTMRSLRTAVVGAALAAALVPATASAATSTSDGGICDDAPLLQPFLTWTDSALYKLAPGGDFEAGSAAWTLRGGAQTVAGNEPFAVGSPSDGSALKLPAGALAVSPVTCVTASYPSFRFFSRSVGAGGKLKVEVIYGKLAVPVNVFTPGDWALSKPTLTLWGLGASASDPAQMSIRFTNVGDATVQVDDVYIDPYARG